jgi:hypothetical protein
MDGLSDTKIRNAKPADKQYTMADGQGFSVLVRPNGTKLWLYRYRFGGKRKSIQDPAVAARLMPRRREVRVSQTSNLGACVRIPFRSVIC